LPNAGALSSDPLASGGWVSAPRPPHHSSYILLILLSQTLEINQKTLFSCNYSGNASGIRRRKKYAAFRVPQTAKIIFIGFKFIYFVPPPHSFCAGTAPDSNF